jgi:hypothetical protein
MDLKSIMSDEKPEDLKKEIVDIFCGNYFSAGYLF